MAITGNNDDLYKASLNMNASSYNNKVGDVQGAVVQNSDHYNLNHNDVYYFNSKKREEAYEAGTVAGKYVLKGKAGVTPQFYTAFSNAFDEYKAVIKGHLKDLETNPDIHQAFSGTEIEGAVKKLIEAVETEAYDYLFKLERAEKTVINSVQKAFQKQQANMGSSMNSDTELLKQGNSSRQEQSNFAKMDNTWSGDGGKVSSGASSGGSGGPSVVRNLTY